MSAWWALLELIAEEVGTDAAYRIEQRARYELGGARVTVSVKPWTPPERLEEIAPGKPKQAAKKLGIGVSTAYRRIRKPLTIR